MSIGTPCERGLPCFVYIHIDTADRDPRLGSIISEIQEQSRITYCLYGNDRELYERVRNDIEAEVTHRFVRSEEVAQTSSGAEIEAILRGQTLVTRPEIEHDILHALRDPGIVQIVGDPGSGKTTLIASTSKNHGFVFISAANLSPLELANAIASKLQLKGQPGPDLGITAASG